MVVSIAILGSGHFVADQHLPAIQQTEGLELKALYSRSKASAEKTGAGLNGVDFYSDDSGPGKGIEDLLARKDIQAVVIALPIPLQAKFIKQALEAKKHVLSEKPVAKDLVTARELLQWYEQYKSSLGGATWGVAENFRFHESILYAREQIKNFGKVTGFHTRVLKLTKPGYKYFETSWRKSPEHQGGFLLDGGVHYCAATRYLLGEENPITEVSAHTSQVQEYLPPVDTLNAICKTASGVSGTIAISFGSTHAGVYEYTVMCEQGSVTAGTKKVITRPLSLAEITKDFPEETQGVENEIAAWAKGLAEGKLDERQSPQLAYKDLELLEGMLTSGQNGGTAQKI